MKNWNIGDSWAWKKWHYVDLPSRIWCNMKNIPYNEALKKHFGLAPRNLPLPWDKFNERCYAYIRCL